MSDNKKQSPVEQAAAEVLKFGQREAELLSQLRAKTTDVADAERTAGDSYLDTEPGSGEFRAAVERVLRLKTEQEALTRAIDACRARRLEAIKRKWAEEVSELRQQTERKKRELADLEAKVAPHLAALSGLEDIPITSAVLCCEANGLGGLHVPKSAKLRAELVGLSGRIVVAESRQLSSSGLVEVSDVTGIEPLLNALSQFEGEVPTVENVISWAEACERSPGRFSDLKRNYSLKWSAGKIDVRQSFVFVESLAPMVADSHPGQPPYRDTHLGHFRAVDEVRYA